MSTTLELARPEPTRAQIAGHHDRAAAIIAEYEAAVAPFTEALKAKLEPLYMAWNEKHAPGLMHDTAAVVVPGDNPMNLVDTADYEAGGKPKFNDFDALEAQLRREYDAQCAPARAEAQSKIDADWNQVLQLT